MAKFFVPMVGADKHKEAYKEFARFVGRAPLPIDQRVSSITWKHDRITWTATVGATLHGTEIVTTGRGRDKREREVPRYSDDTVLAIFPGIPGMIVHDNKNRRWNLPILTGELLIMAYFAN